jgi:hypothetical protein
MFLNYLKNFFVKNKLKNNGLDLKYESNPTIIKSVGLLVDGSNFSDTKVLVQHLISEGFSLDNIQICVYKNKIAVHEMYSYPTFGMNSVRWNGTISEIKLNDFIQTEFDLLISYYDTEKPILLLITNQSKSKFKVGFSSIDQRLNHLMINTHAQNHAVFVKELIKYLKILNKIKS